MITITGATGQLGAAVVDFLIAKGVDTSEISGLARAEEKAQILKDKGINVKLANYDDYQSMVEAFKGTDKLLFVSGNDMAHRDRQHLDLLKAAKEADVKHILYTSFQRQSESAESPLTMVIATHLLTEKAIKESGIPYTILRNNLYMDMLPMMLGENVFETGVFFPAQDGKVAFTLRDDMAEATANVLIGEGHENKEYNFSNGHSLTFAEVAEHLSTISGKTINYISPSVEEYAKALAGAGVPEMYIGMMTTFGVAIEKNELITADTDLPKLLGREAVSFKEFLNGVYANK